MNLYFKDGISRIDFRIDANDPYLLDKASFAYLVMMRQQGELHHAELVDDVVYIEITFEPHEYPEARSHCFRNLIKEDWSIRPDYVGALDRADPDRYKTKEMLRDAGVDL